MWRMVVGLLQMALVVALIAGGTGAQILRAKQIMREWLKETGKQPIQSEVRFFDTGPFILTFLRGQYVFRIAIVDADGVRRDGWLRVGNFFGVFFSDKAEVVWDA
ncbi:hypothetical protein [Verrucomicrobium sp. BvORR106]|uniref:hypothetical protein n=1 Tax=Verrucomicrobium sp. BvORR106 TaxID=1403819 RepID=UPI002240F18E|nr:hypothetical protein [Verrucomicrobium sp. BvORR106]